MPITEYLRENGQFTVFYDQNVYPEGGVVFSIGKTGIEIFLPDIDAEQPVVLLDFFDRKIPQLLLFTPQRNSDELARVLFTPEDTIIGIENGTRQLRRTEHPAQEFVAAYVMDE